MFKIMSTVNVDSNGKASSETIKSMKSTCSLCCRRRVTENSGHAPPLAPLRKEKVSPTPSKSSKAWEKCRIRSNEIELVNVISKVCRERSKSRHDTVIYISLPRIFLGCVDPCFYSAWVGESYPSRRSWKIALHV